MHRQEPYTPDQPIRRLVISVSAAQIEAAIPANSGHCMIADAVKAAVPEAKAVNVDLASIRWTNPREGRRYIYLTPPSVQHALLEFDNGIKPEPFRFALRAPSQITVSGTEAVKREGRVNHGLAQVTSDSKDRPTIIGGRAPSHGPLTNAPDTQTEARPGSQDRHKNLPTPESQLMRGRRRQFGVRKMGRPILSREELAERANLEPQ